MNRRGQTLTGPLGGSGMVGRWGASSLVKSVQRGTINITTGGSASATITAVDLNNSIIRYLNFTNGALNQYDFLPMLELTNATLVNAYRYSTDPNGTTVSFEVVEYLPGVIKSVQRGNATFASTTPKNTTITEVNLNKAQLDFMGWRFNNSGSMVTYVNMWVRLSSSTNIEANTQSPNTQQFGYQVVEWF